MKSALKSTLSVLLVLALAVQAGQSFRFFKRLRDRFRSSGTEYRSIGEEVFKLINTYRKDKGLDKLTWASRAYKAANEHNKYQAKQKNATKDNTSKLLKKLGSSAEINVFSNNTSIKPSDTNEAAAALLKEIGDSSSAKEQMKTTEGKYGAVAVRYVKSSKTYYVTFLTHKND